MKNKEQFRHEWKYLISPAQKALICQRLSTVLTPDPNAGDGGYTIRSLYFDDYWNSALEEKEAGVFLRKKYRIRIYNGSDAVIRLERKKKAGSYIYKEAAPLTRLQTEQLIHGDYGFLLKSPYSLCREFYIECMCHVMRPRVIVDYEREPWVMDAGTVRITFDRDVRAAIGGCDLFDPGLPCLPVLEEGKLIMEVKYTQLLPSVVRELLPPSGSEFTAASKYVLCCEKTSYLHGFDYWK